MKLIGSKIENEYRDELIESYSSCSEEKKQILSILRNQYPNLFSVYILDWIPEQGEAFYTVLIDPNTIAVILLNLINKDEFDVKFISLKEYQKNLSKMKKLKLYVALDLIRKNNLNDG